LLKFTFVPISCSSVMTRKKFNNQANGLHVTSKVPQVLNRLNLFTVMIRIPDKSGFKMVDLCPVVEWSGFWMVGHIVFTTSLDCLYKKKIFIKIQNGPVYSEPFENQTNLSSFQTVGHLCYHSKTGPNFCQKNDHSKTGRSSFQIITVIVYFLNNLMFLLNHFILQLFHKWLYNCFTKI
jgi:hypothetical protein